MTVVPQVSSFKGREDLDIVVIIIIITYFHVLISVYRFSNVIYASVTV